MSSVTLQVTVIFQACYLFRKRNLGSRSPFMQMRKMRPYRCYVFTSRHQYFT